MMNELLMVVLVLVLEVLMNHIMINDEDSMGYFIRSFDGMTYGEKKHSVHFQKVSEEKGGCGVGGIMICSINMKSIQRISCNLM